MGVSVDVLFVASGCGHYKSFHVPYFQLLQGMGYAVYAAAQVTSPDCKSSLEALGVTVINIDMPRSPFSLSALAATLQLWRIMRERRYRLIHVHTPLAAFLGRLLARLTNQPQVLYTAHGFHFFQGAPWQNWLLYYPLEKLAARWTHGLIVINQEDYSLAQRLGHKIIHCVRGVGVDIPQYSPMVPLKSEGKPFVVTCVAQLNHNKNHSFLLTAWKHFHDSYPNSRLHLVGRGELATKLRNWCQQEDIQGVEFLGYRHDIPDILQRSNVFVLVSKREGLPRSIMEAMAAGKAVIASNIRGNRDLVVNGETGILVKLGNVAELSDALTRLYIEADLAIHMGARGQERIKAYSLSEVIPCMREIYEKHLLQAST